MKFDPSVEPCGYCGREPDECICHLAPDFPDDVIDELDTDYLNSEYYEEYNKEKDDEGGGQPANDPATQEQGLD